MQTFCKHLSAASDSYLIFYSLKLQQIKPYPKPI